jgi:Holliday junction resolvasome RuvABC endonuclease subunit
MCNESMNLPANATAIEIRQAIAGKRASENQQLLSSVRQQLGLPSNATNDDIKNALSTWVAQNQDILKMLHMRHDMDFHGRW